MRLYVVTEGLFESYLYPEWFKYLLPEYTNIKHIDDVNMYENCYYFISNKGYNACYDQKGIPAVYNTIINGLKDIYNYDLFDMLVYLGDSENIPYDNPLYCINQRKNIIYDYIRNNAEIYVMELAKSKLKLIIQHNCIETWLLGNKKLIKQNINDTDLKVLIDMYNVRNNDPELMTMDYIPDGKQDIFKTVPQFHKYYLRKIVNFATKAQVNTKNIKNSYTYFSGNSYLKALINRYKKDNHIKSFGYFFKNTEQK